MVKKADQWTSLCVSPLLCTRLRVAPEVLVQHQMGACTLDSASGVVVVWHHVSLVLLSFAYEGCWTGGNSSGVLDTVGCQRCWLLGAGPASSWSQTLLLLWLCCRAWGIQSIECNYCSKGFYFIGSPMLKLQTEVTMKILYLLEMPLCNCC